MQRIKLLTQRLFFLGFSLSLLSCVSQGEKVKEQSDLGPVIDEQERLVLLFLSDLHGRLRSTSDQKGGYARIASVIKNEREQAGPKTDVFAVVVGDVVGKGHMPCRETKDKVCLPLLKDIGFDLVAVGNGELYAGMRGLKSYVSDTSLPWLSSNVSSTTGQRTPWESGFRYRGPKSGMEFWAFSWVRNPYKGRSMPRRHGIQVKERVTAGDWDRWERRSQGAPIIWMNHQLWKDDLYFSQAACTRPKLNSLLFVSSDAHKQALNEEACAPVMQASEYGQTMGRVSFVKNREGKWSIESRSFIAVDESFGEDPAIAAKIDALYTRYAPKALDKVDDLPRPMSPKELGEWFAGALRSATHSDLAVINSGAIKSGFPAGLVTKEDLYLAAPYNNTVVGLDWSFRSLEKALCESSRRERDEELDHGSDLYLAGGFLINPGTPNCKLQLDRGRQNVKVTMDSYVASRSERWLGRDVSKIAFSFGFKIDKTVDLRLKSKGGLR